MLRKRRIRRQNVRNKLKLGKADNAPPAGLGGGGNMLGIALSILRSGVRILKRFVVSGGIVYKTLDGKNFKIRR